VRQRRLGFAPFFIQLWVSSHTTKCAGTGWPNVIVAVIMAILALQGAVLVIRQAVNELRLPIIATA
jgi:hypothetical protein